MKKMTKLVAAMAILASVLMMCGCGLKSAIDSTHNKWYKYNKAEGIDIPLGADTSADAASAVDLKNAEFYVYFDDDNGLLVAVQSTKSENVELYKGLLTQTVDITVGSTKQYTKEEFGTAKWTAMIALGNFTQCEAPKIVANPEQCFIITNALENGIQWKKVLANILLDSLLSE